MRNIEANLDRRDKGVTSRRAEREAETERLALEEDEATIAAMNTKRAAEGRPPLGEHQAQMVRDQRRRRRQGANNA